MDKRIKKIIWGFVICIVLILVMSYLIYFVKRMGKFKYEDSLKYKKADIVYSLSNDSIKSGDSLPVFNLVGSNIESINTEIIDLYNYYALEKGYTFTYDYNVSKDSVSVLITMNYLLDGKNNLSYKAYNVDLVNMKLLSDDAIFKKFDIDSDKINFFLTNKFFNYYTNLIDKKVINQNTCDFSCFLDNCNFEDFGLGNSYYINNNKLEIYKFFNVYSKYNYDKYFNDNSFRFVVR